MYKEKPNYEPSLFMTRTKRDVSIRKRDAALASLRLNAADMLATTSPAQLERLRNGLSRNVTDYIHYAQDADKLTRFLDNSEEYRQLVEGGLLDPEIEAPTLEYTVDAAF